MSSCRPALAAEQGGHARPTPPLPEALTARLGCSSRFPRPPLLHSSSHPFRLRLPPWGRAEDRCRRRIPKFATGRLRLMGHGAGGHHNRHPLLTARLRPHCRHHGDRLGALTLNRRAFGPIPPTSRFSSRAAVAVIARFPGNRPPPRSDTAPPDSPLRGNMVRARLRRRSSAAARKMFYLYIAWIRKRETC
ncbi:uncharacterized protein LOC133898440 isoform X2 [Phragmites australis]|uniref:uncharacterized protein LOC133898440 isoform X2 n=1 Tax=Phragmites australis TaxID=29695 RepID=UPI002D7A1967|nr:uncharacterized protein LOC133898440 isoform X2 [Phragmites australis]